MTKIKLYLFSPTRYYNNSHACPGVGNNNSIAQVVHSLPCDITPPIISRIVPFIILQSGAVPATV